MAAKRTHWLSRFARRRPFLFAAGIFSGGAALSLSAAEDFQSPAAEKAYAVVDSVARSSRAALTIAFVVVDYKYSLHGISPDSEEYQTKLSQAHLRSARKLLKLCEANRGFYVKAGQFVSSMRRIPKEYSSTLSSLQDQAVPCKFTVIKRVIMKNLGKDLCDIFLTFDERPIAAASIAQVHRALLKNNQEVAVKVQYPGLEQRMKIDLTTMALLSKSVSWVFPDYRFERILSEFERAISMELDLLTEAKNAERVAKNFEKNGMVKVPYIFKELTTAKVLTMQFCNGRKVDDVEFLKKSGIDSIKVAKALMEVFAEMTFVHGFIHGDPHPGNILVSSEGRGRFSLVLLDHGIYRELDEKFRLDYCQLWKALILMDPKQIQLLGDHFGVGNYSKYFPIIFTGRTIESKSAFDTEMSDEEKRRLKQEELRLLKMGDLSPLMDLLPPEFLSILRTDGLLRSIVNKLGAPRHVRLLAYANYAAYGLRRQYNSQSDYTIRNILSVIRGNIDYLQLRTVIAFLSLLSQVEDVRHSLMAKLRNMLDEVVEFFSKKFLVL